MADTTIKYRAESNKNYGNLKQHLSIELQKQIKALQEANEAAFKEWQAKIEKQAISTYLDKFRQISTKYDRYNVASIKYIFKYTDV